MDKFKFGLFQHSRASHSKVDSRIWPNFKHVQGFMAVLFICKFHNDLIKKYCLTQGHMVAFWHSRASKSNKSTSLMNIQ